MRRLTILALVLLAGLGLARADNSLSAITSTFNLISAAGDPMTFGAPIAQIGGGIFGTPRLGRTLTVAKSGGQYRVICGANCAVETAPCAGGSALASITDASITNPVTIVVYPGRYDECVSFDNITDVSLVGTSRDAVIIRPTVTVASSVTGGVIRFGKITATQNSTARIEVSNITAWNDASSGPESAFMAGIDAGGPGAGNPSTWNDLYIHDNKAVGNHDGIQWFGSRKTSDLDLPRIWVENNLIITGADGIAAKGWSVNRVLNNNVRVQSNWCESTDTANLAVESAAVACDTACGNSQFNLAASGVSAVDGFYNGRKITMTGGSCPVVGQSQHISAYTGSTRRVTVGIAFTGTPDTTCTYTIDAVTHNNGAAYVVGDVQDSPCLDADWNTVNPSWKSTCFHMGIGTNETPVPLTDSTVVDRLTCDIVINDRGPVSLSSNSCSTQIHVTPILLNASNHRDINISNVTSRTVINTDMEDTVGCNANVTGVGFVGNIATIEGTASVSNVHHTLINRGDTDTVSQCVSVNQPSVGAGVLNVSNVSCNLFNTVGGYTGAKNHIFRDDAGVGTLVVHDISANELLKTSGTFAGWAEACIYVDAGLDSAIAAITDLPVPITSSENGVQIGYTACRCYGTCGNAEAVNLEDENNNSIGTTTCVDNTTAVLTWTDVRADADSDVIGGCTPPNTCAVSPRLTVTQRGSAVGDDLMFCVRFNTTRF